MRVRFYQNRKLILFYSILTGLGLLIRLYRIGQESLWFDETLSVFFARQPFWISLDRMIEEGLHHSPLFYILLRPFMQIDQLELSARLLSALLGTLAIPLMGWIVQELVSPFGGILAAAIIAFNPYHVWYSREARMYTLMFLASAGAMLCFLRIVRDQPNWKHWAGLVFFTSIAINTHHFGFYLPLIQFVFIVLTLRKNYLILRKWVLAMFLSGLTFVPWIIYVVRTGQFYGSSASTRAAVLTDLLKTFWNFTLGYTIQVTLFVVVGLVIFGMLALKGLQTITGTTRKLLLIWLLLPPLLTFLISLRLPLYMDRYLIISMPPLIVLVAAGLASLKPIALQAGLIAAVGVVTLFSTARVYFDDSIYERADWRGVSAQLSVEAQAGRDMILTLQYQDLLSYQLYYHGQMQIQPLVIWDHAEFPNLEAYASNHPGFKLWFVIPYINQSMHLVGHCQPFNEDIAPHIAGVIEWREKLRPRLVKVEQFNCIRLEEYQY